MKIISFTINNQLRFANKKQCNILLFIKVNGKDLKQKKLYQVLSNS